MKPVISGTAVVRFIALRPATSSLVNNSGDIGMAKPTQADAEAAVRVLIEWAGDDPGREGLIQKPINGRLNQHYRRVSDFRDVRFPAAIRWKADPAQRL